MSSDKPRLVAVPPDSGPTRSRPRRRPTQSQIQPPTDGSLALHYPAEPPATALAVVPTPALRLVPDPESRPDGDVAGPPEVSAWAARLVQAIAEVVVGDRPVGQLVRWVEPAVYADLYRRVRLLGLTTSAGIRTASDRSSIRSVRVCAPAEGAVEVAAHVRHGARSRAIALRLEIHRDRWICTALEMG